jgi:hypothetical protein
MLYPLFGLKLSGTGDHCLPAFVIAIGTQHLDQRVLEPLSVPVGLGDMKLGHVCRQLRQFLLLHTKRSFGPVEPRGIE